MDHLLALTLSDQAALVLGQLTTDGTGLLGTQVLGQVLFLGVGALQLGTLVLAEDGQDTSDGLANVTTRQ